MTTPTLLETRMLLTDPWWEREEYAQGELELPGQSRLGPDERQLLEEVATAANRGHIEIPAMPKAAMEATRLLRDPDCAIDEVSECIQLDPAMVAQILKHANSPLYGVRYPIDTVSRAVSTLGLRRLKAVVLEVALKRMVSDANAQAYARMEWDYAVACAAIARALAIARKLDAELCYSCGLLHDVGRLPLLQALSARKALDGPPVEDNGPEIIIESLHRGVGLQVAEGWELSPALQDAVGSHLSGRRRGEESLAQFPSTKVVEAAGDICLALGLGRFPKSFNVLECQSLEDLGFDRKTLTAFFRDELPHALKHLTAVA